MDEPDDVAEDDLSSMLAAVEQQLEPRVVARALGVRERELDSIRAGHVPDDATAAKLRMLYRLSREADLHDPSAIVAALTGDPALGNAVRSPFALLAVPRVRTAVIAFFVFDAIVFLVVIAFVLRSTL